jgi:hypothetical protein
MMLSADSTMLSDNKFSVIFLLEIFTHTIKEVKQAKFEPEAKVPGHHALKIMLHNKIVDYLCRNLHVPIFSWTFWQSR